MKLDNKMKFYITLSFIAIFLITISVIENESGQSLLSDIGQFVKGSPYINPGGPIPITPTITCTDSDGLNYYNMGLTASDGIAMSFLTETNETILYSGKDYLVQLDVIVEENNQYVAVGNINGESFLLGSGQIWIMADGTKVGAISVIMGKTGEPGYAKIIIGVDSIEEDYCQSNTTVAEYYCDGSVRTIDEYYCDGGCSDGACLSTPIELSLPDLIVSNVYYDGPSYIFVDYCNIGNGSSASDFLIKIQNQSTGLEYGGNFLYRFPVPAPGTCATTGGFTCGILGLTCGDLINISVSIDWEKRVNESDETNNMLSKQIGTYNNIATCTDSDGGNNQYQKGQVFYKTSSGNLTNVDYCMGNQLLEYYCIYNTSGLWGDVNWTIPVFWANMDYTCLNGCSDGACIQTEEPTLYCGDGICNGVETCSSCAGDCGACSCAGDIYLALIPGKTRPSQTIVGSISGLTPYCTNATARIRSETCAGTIVCATTITSSGTGSCSFTAPNSTGNYNYMACVDKNNDGDYSDAGESYPIILFVSWCANLGEKCASAPEGCCSGLSCTDTICVKPGIIPTSIPESSITSESQPGIFIRLLNFIRNIFR
ncbi:MAG: hypothetical protein KJ906_02815 [Nanoarchaeota archaeon]|nr:hypothetical protein [Nanoarchaeota archaeon]